MRFKDFLTENKPLIDKEINQVFKRYTTEASLIDSSVKKIIEALEEFNSRDGKRIRPLLVMLGYQMFGGKDPSMIQIATSMELIHAFLLIHDDIMDKSTLRREKPTLHRIYEKQDDKYFGISKALVAGDTLMFIAYQNIIESGVDKWNLAIEMLNRTILNTCYGQIIDFCPDAINEETILQIYKFKTSMYTIEGPLRLGARLAGAPEEQLKTLHDFAIPLGIAFQIQDDMLDVFPKIESGKEAYKDIKEGKYTLLVDYAINNCTYEENKFMKNNIGKKKDTETIERIKSIILSSGSKNYSEKKIKEYGEKSFSVLEKSDLGDDQKKLLIEFADMILKRKK